MKVLFCASDNSATSGAFLCLLDLCILLKKDNIDTMVILPYEGTGTELLKCNQIPYKLIKSYSWTINKDKQCSIVENIKFIIKFFLNIVAILRIYRVISEEEVTIVHNNTTWGYVGIIAALLARKKCVWHFREVMELSQNSTIAYGWNFAGFLMKRTDRLVAVSNFVKKYFEEKLQLPVDSIYDGVDSKFILPERDVFENQVVNIALIGGLSKGKGQEFMVDALTRIDSSVRSKLCLIFIGGYDEKDKKYILDKAKKANVYDNVLLMGIRNDMENVYASTDIVCVCSNYEAFGRTIAEGMLAGCLIIGPNSGSADELIVDKVNGYKYEADNADSMAECIKYAILNRHESNELAKQGCRIAKQKYTNIVNEKNIKRMYIECLAEKSN